MVVWIDWMGLAAKLGSEVFRTQDGTKVRTVQKVDGDSSEDTNVGRSRGGSVGSETRTYRKFRRVGRLGSAGLASTIQPTTNRIGNLLQSMLTYQLTVNARDFSVDVAHDKIDGYLIA